jgi:thiol-disulfide isomerase/thioredoxin
MIIGNHFGIISLLLTTATTLPVAQSLSHFALTSPSVRKLPTWRDELNGPRAGNTSGLHSPLNGASRLPVSLQSSPTTSLYAGMKFKNFEHVLDTFHDETVIICFETAKCGPCRIMKKELESVRKIIGDDLKIFSLDAEKFPHLGSRYDIHRLPCLVFVRHGEILLRLEGVTKAAVVAEQVRALR